MSSQSQTTSHVCLALAESRRRSNFCQTCGLYLPGGAQKAVRSARFAGRDFMGASSPSVLAEMIRKQSRNRFFNTQPHHLNFRDKVLAWMESLVAKFGYGLATLHLAVGYFDAVLSQFTVTVPQIKLISYICLFLAAKMEERDEKIPMIEEAFKLFDKEFTSTEIINCEKLVFKILNYELNLKTPYAFVSFFLSKGVVMTSEVAQQNNESELARQVEDLAFETVTRALKGYEMYQFTSIAIAAASVAISRSSLGLSAWSAELEALTMLSWSSIRECADALKRYIEPAESRTPVSPVKSRRDSERNCSVSTEEETWGGSAELSPNSTFQAGRQSL